MPREDTRSGKRPRAYRPIVGTRGERTRSLVIVALLQILQSLAILSYGLYRMMSGDPERWLGEYFLRFTPFALFEGISSGWFFILLSILFLVVAVALFQMRVWAWKAAITLQGIGLMTALIGYLRGQPNYIGMVMGIILVLYLNLDDVQSAFGQR